MIFRRARTKKRKELEMAAVPEKKKCTRCAGCRNAYEKSPGEWVCRKREQSPHGLSPEDQHQHKIPSEF